MKNQIDLGLGVCDKFMERRLFMGCDSAAQSFASFQRRVLQDASQKGWTNAELDSMFHLGYIDMTKLGRLAATDIGDCASWAHRVLALNPDRSCVVKTHLLATTLKQFSFVLPTNGVFSSTKIN